MYDFTSCLSPIDFELLSKDLLEAELNIQLENFSEGRDKGIDLRYSPVRINDQSSLQHSNSNATIVQCKRYSKFSDLISNLKNKELVKIAKLKPVRYILTTSASLSPQQSEDILSILSPFILSTGDIYGRERLNSILNKHPEIVRRHIKLWISSVGVLDSIIHAGTHLVSQEEIERTIAAAKIYVRNDSFDEALSILNKHHVCVISGLPGIGKTTLARMLLLYYLQKEHDVIKIESDISEARAVGYHKKPRFYFYDDFLGQTSHADKLNKNEDQKLLDFMESIRASKDSVFVLTTREYILNQAKLNYEKLAREKFEHRTCIIDLSKYSRRIKAQIFYNHLHFSDLPSAFVETIVANHGYVQIVDHANYSPRLIQYLTNFSWVESVPASEYLKFFLRNLDNPVEIWEHAFNNQLSKRAQHLLFVLTTMPKESFITDIEYAFRAFHISQCTKFLIQNSATDFKDAMKELDGTFIFTRKIQESLLVRFQNPSIRDFMQNLLLCGELLEEILSTLVFFEQVEWFIETLNNKQPRISLNKLKNHVVKLSESGRKLFDVNSCSIEVTGIQQWQRVTIKVSNPVNRLAIAAIIITRQGGDDSREWLEARLSELANQIESGKLSISYFAGPIDKLKNLGCLRSNAGKNLVSCLKNHVLDDLNDLDAYDNLAYLINVLPEVFEEPDLEVIREEYSVFTDMYASIFNVDNPDQLREDASLINKIGNILNVDTTYAQDTLREAAIEIENAEASQLDDDDYRHNEGNIDLCSNRELISMFNTLVRSYQ